MGPVLLAIPGNPIAELAPFVSGLDAHAEDLNLIRNVSFGLVNEGRHLGPAPRSPTATIKEYDSRRSFVDLFGRNRQARDPDSASIFDSVGDSRRNGNVGGLANGHAVIRACALRLLSH